MTQTGKTIMGGIAVLLLVILLVALGSRSMRTSLESESRATSTQTGGTAATSSPVANQQDPLNPLKGVTTEEGKKCVAAGGVWNETFRECAAVNKDACTSIGGKYDECASPCRNDPNAEVCMEMCVQICSFKKSAQ